MTTYMSPRTGAKIVRLMMAMLIMFLLLITYVFVQAYEGRSALVDSQRAGCERGKKDRAAGVISNQSILEAFLETDKQIPGPITNTRAEAERNIRATIDDLNARAYLDCTKEYPKAGLFP